MKVVGLITEYNPFHNGHMHHLLKAKETTQSDYSIAVMSGHFLQRGEPAILDKWTRARAAVEAGVDLVLEIPTLFACSSAEYFAYGSVSLLDSLGIVDTLCFGSEDGKLGDLIKVAKLLNQPTKEFNTLITTHLEKGLSYPKARELTLNELLEGAIDLKPNNILGIEYLKALREIRSSIRPYTIQRINADYNSLELKGNIASATGIRNALFNSKDLNNIQNFVPRSTYKALGNSKEQMIFKHDLTTVLLYKIRSTSLLELKRIHDVTEGLEYKIKKAAETATTYDELMDGIISKRFTQTRIQRILIKILLGITKEDIGSRFEIKPEYARILAFNEKGQYLIKKIKKQTDFPLITNINKTNLHLEGQNMLDFDIKATNIYNLLYKNISDHKGGTDYIKAPEMV